MAALIEAILRSLSLDEFLIIRPISIKFGSNKWFVKVFHLKYILYQFCFSFL